MSHTNRLVSFFSAFPLLLHVLFLGGLLLGCALFLNQVPLHDREAFSLGSTDNFIAQDFYPAETTLAGRGYRWTNGDSTLHVSPQGLGSHILQLSLAAPHPTGAGIPVTITVNNKFILTAQVAQQSRRFVLLIPSEHVGANENLVRIQSPTFRPQDETDPRTLGIVVFEVIWQQLWQQNWLLPVQFAALALTLIIFYLLLYISSIRFGERIFLMCLFVAIALAMRYSDSRFIYRVQGIMWLSGFGSLCVLSCLILRKYENTFSLMPLQKWLELHWKAFAGYCLATAIMLYPLVLHFTDHILGSPGDSYEFLWKLQWFSDALLKQHVSPAFAPQLFYPAGFDLAHTDMAPTQTLLGLPITFFFGPIISYNTALIVSYVLTGFFTYLLAYRLGATRGAAWVAGIAFAFCIRRFYHATGHLSLTGTQWLPLALYGWEGVLTRRRTWDGFVSGIGLGLTAWSSWYFAPTFALLLACYTPLRLGIRQLPDLIRGWHVILLAGVITFALVFPLAQPYVEARQRGETFKQNLRELSFHAAQPKDYFMPNPYHPLWGHWARQLDRQDGTEHLVALGYTLLLLALAGIWLGRSRGTIVRAFVVIILINVIMSFGPYLQLPNGEFLTLPALFIYEHVPILNGIRVWNRMVLYIVLSAAVLASFTLSALPRHWQRACCTIATGLILAEFASVAPLSAPEPRPVDLWLRQQPGSGTVIQVPNGFGGTSAYYSLFSGKPNNLGFATFAPPAYAQGCRGVSNVEKCDTLLDFPSDDAVHLLQRWETEYVIVDNAMMKQYVPNWEFAVSKNKLFRLVYRDGEYMVYYLNAPS